MKPWLRVIGTGLVLFSIYWWLDTSDRVGGARDAVLTGPVDHLVVRKAARRLLAYRGYTLVKEYRIALGFAPEGHKEYEGDGKTPEGRYTINDRNPNSSYHLNLGIDYPNDADRAHARTLGKSPGGDIKIHGLPNGRGAIGKAHRLKDWTHGCIAVTNEEIEELYEWVVNGASIDIQP